MVLQNRSPCPDEFCSVALSAGAPHGGAFGAVKYAELYCGLVSNQSHVSSKSIYLSDYLSFSYTTNSRIATHLRNLVHVHGDETGLGAHLCGSGGSLTTGMSGTDYYYIILEIHTDFKVSVNNAMAI